MIKMVKTKLLISGIIFLLALNIVFAYTPPAGSPLANREHPRLLITNADLPRIRANLGTGGIAHNDFKTWIAEMDAQYNSVNSNNDPGSLKYQARNFAFIYLVGTIQGVNYGHTMTEYGAKGKTAMNRLMQLQSAVGGYDNEPTPLTYDWLYPLWTAQEKTAIVNWMKTIFSQPFAMPSRNDPWNSQTSTARNMAIMIALSYYGDGVDDASANAGLDAYSTLIRGPLGSLDAENWYAGDDGGMGQGHNYGLGYSMPSYLNMVEMWRTANGLGFDIYNNEAVIKTAPLWSAYSFLPFASPSTGSLNGRRWVFWKTWAMESGGNSWQSRYYFGTFPYIFQNVDPGLASLAKWLQINRIGTITPRGSDGLYYAVPNLFIYANSVVPKSPSEVGLPLNREFSHMGWVTMRTGWDSLDDTLVTFNAPEFATSGYDTIRMFKKESGSFTIDRKGPLVVHAGGGHYARTWASNILLFVPPNPPSGYAPDAQDSGGQRIYWPGCSSGYGMMTENGPCDMREGNLKIQFRDASAGRDYSYIGANLVRAYNGPDYKSSLDTPKVKKYTRQMVYFYPDRPGTDPDRIIVIDRAESVDAAYEKRWLMHTSQAPTINGIESIGVPVRGGSGVNKATYLNSDLITMTNTANGANGKVFLKPLLPASRKIVKVTGQQNPYVGSEIDDNVQSSLTMPYAGYGHIEIIPSTSNTYDVFLNVIEATDSGVSSMTPSVLLQGANMQGARFGDRIVMFNQNEAVLTSGNFVIDQAGAYKVLIADLAPGATYTVSHNPTITQTASSAGTIYVDITTALPNTPVTVTQSGVAPPSSFDFTLSNGGSRAVAQGSSVTNTITATLTSGSASIVSYSVSGLPIGATASFSPTSCNPTCTATMTINSASSTPTGAYTITVTGIGSGVSRTTSFSLTVTSVGDITPPAASITAPSSGSNVSGTITISATASDNVGVARVEFYVDGALKGTDTSSPYSYSWDTTNGGTHPCNGAHTHAVIARAYDSANNIGSSPAVTVNMNNPSYCAADITPPARSNGLPSGTLPVNTASAALSLLTSEPATCRYSTEPNIAYSSMTNTLSTTGGTSHSASVAGLSVGNTYNYYVRCIDATGNVNTDDYTIIFRIASISSGAIPSAVYTYPLGTAGKNYRWILRVSDGRYTTEKTLDVKILDKTPPTVSITSPASGTTVSGIIILTATAGDNIGVEGVQFKIDGSSIGSEDTTAPYSVSWDTTTVANGAHTITAVARDTNGNTATALINANVNNVIPSLPNPGDANNDGIVDLFDAMVVTANWGRTYD